MMTISTRDWLAYINKLRKINDDAANVMRDYLEKNMATASPQEMIDYAYMVAQKYSEGSATLAAMMYDEIAALEGVAAQAAELAALPTYGDVAKTVNGIRKFSDNVDLIAEGVARLVKQTAVDTTMQNALRDGAEWAWIPHGDTCAFCIALASRGWQMATSKAMKNGHAEHIHANCDCTYAIRFSDATDVAGYDPDKYLQMYEDGAKQPYEDKDAAHMTSKYASNKNINGMRRMFYQQNKEEINAQKRDAYAKRKELESDKATETNVGAT